MSSFIARSAKHFAVIKAAREIKKEIEKAGLDNLKLLCENGVSIVGTYLNGCAPKEQATVRQQFKTFLAMGVTAEMVLDQVTGQIPELQSIIARKPDYRKAELQKIEEFLKRG